MSMEVPPGEEGGMIEYDRDKFDDLNNRRLELYKMFLKEGPEFADEFYNACIERGNELRSQYKNVEAFAAFHALVGSNPDPKNVDKNDFPDNDSVEKFLSDFESNFKKNNHVN